MVIISAGSIIECYHVFWYGIRFVLTTDNMQLTISRLKTTQNNSTHNDSISVSVQTTTINHRYVTLCSTTTTTINHRYVQATVTMMHI
eukprot:UN06480